MNGAYLLEKPCHLVTRIVLLLNVAKILVFSVVAPGVPRFIPTNAIASPCNSGLDLNRELPDSGLGSGMDDGSATDSCPNLSTYLVSNSV